MIITLVDPQIPQNTGNIARLCAANHIPLHLVGDLGYELSDAKLKRAGLDYWDHVNVTHFPDKEAYFNNCDPMTLHLLSSKGSRFYTRQTYRQGDRLVFGSETTGLGQTLLKRFEDRAATIPMANPDIRCLNLATSVGIVAYEALRQLSAPK